MGDLILLQYGQLQAQYPQHQPILPGSEDDHYYDAHCNRVEASFAGAKYRVIATVDRELNCCDYVTKVIYAIFTIATAGLLLVISSVRTFLCSSRVKQLLAIEETTIPGYVKPGDATPTSSPKEQEIDNETGPSRVDGVPPPIETSSPSKSTQHHVAQVADELPMIRKLRSATNLPLMQGPSTDDIIASYYILRRHSADYLWDFPHLNTWTDPKVQAAVPSQWLKLAQEKYDLLIKEYELEERYLKHKDPPILNVGDLCLLLPASRLIHALLTDKELGQLTGADIWCAARGTYFSHPSLWARLQKLPYLGTVDQAIFSNPKAVRLQDWCQLTAETINSHQNPLVFPSEIFNLFSPKEVPYINIRKLSFQQQVELFNRRPEMIAAARPDQIIELFRTGVISLKFLQPIQIIRIIRDCPSEITQGTFEKITNIEFFKLLTLHDLNLLSKSQKTELNELFGKNKSDSRLIGVKFPPTVEMAAAPTLSSTLNVFYKSTIFSLYRQLPPEHPLMQKIPIKSFSDDARYFINRGSGLPGLPWMDPLLTITVHDWRSGKCKKEDFDAAIAEQTQQKIDALSAQFPRHLEQAATTIQIGDLLGPISSSRLLYKLCLPEELPYITPYDLLALKQSPEMRTQCFKYLLLRRLQDMPQADISLTSQKAFANFYYIPLCQWSQIRAGTLNAHTDLQALPPFIFMLLAPTEIPHVTLSLLSEDQVDALINSEPAIQSLTPEQLIDAFDRIAAGQRWDLGKERRAHWENLTTRQLLFLVTDARTKDKMTPAILLKIEHNVEFILRLTEENFAALSTEQIAAIDKLINNTSIIHPHYNALKKKTSVARKKESSRAIPSAKPSWDPKWERFQHLSRDEWMNLKVCDIVAVESDPKACAEFFSRYLYPRMMELALPVENVDQDHFANIAQVSLRNLPHMIAGTINRHKKLKDFPPFVLKLVAIEMVPSIDFERLSHLQRFYLVEGRLAAASNGQIVAEFPSQEEPVVFSNYYLTANQLLALVRNKICREKLSSSDFKNKKLLQMLTEEDIGLLSEEQRQVVISEKAKKT